MRDARVGGHRRGFPRSTLQCRQCRTRVVDLAPNMQGGGFFCDWRIVLPRSGESFHAYKYVWASQLFIRKMNHVRRKSPSSCLPFLASTTITDIFKGDNLTPIQARNKMTTGPFILYIAQCIRGRPDSDRKPRTRCGSAVRRWQYRVARK